MLEIGPTTLVQILNFLFLLFILNFLLFKPLLKVIKEREAQVSGTLKEAEIVNQEAKKAKEEYEKKLAEVKEEAMKLKENIIKDGERIKQEKIKEGEKEYQKWIEKAKFEIELEKIKMMEELKSGAFLLAVSIAEKALKEALPENLHRVAVEHIVKKVAS